MKEILVYLAKLVGIYREPTIGSITAPMQKILGDLDSYAAAQAAERERLDE